MWAVSFITAQTAAYFGMGPSDGILYLTAITDAVCILVFLYLKKSTGWYIADTEDVRAGRRRIEKAVPPLFARLVILFLLGMGCSVLSDRLFAWLGLYERFSNATQEALLSFPLPAQLIALVFLSPLCEELCYRELGYGSLRRIINRPAAALFTALLFAAGHGNMIQFFYALPMGAVLCACYEWGAGLPGAFAFHAGANLISVLLAAFSA